METFDIYRDIAKRTDGSVYVGVVGPVRTGKSTFIKHFMDLLVIPGIEDENERSRVTDELPQSGAGKTVMTTQPRFVPNDAVEIPLGGDACVSVRMVDCVGFMVDGALGADEDGAPRMVRTPWSDGDLPFEQAAEIGTRKVIAEHSTIGVVMTTDGTICDLPRSAYARAEERCIKELQAAGKPFAIVLNSAEPASEMAVALRKSLAEKYGVPVVLMNVLLMQKADVTDLLRDILYEFPIRRIDFEMSGWVCALSEEHWLLSSMLETVRESVREVSRLRDYKDLAEGFAAMDTVRAAKIDGVYPGEGAIGVRVDVEESLFYRVLGDECGYEIEDDLSLIRIMKELVAAKQDYDRIESALQSVRTTGYGIVAPGLEEISLEEPEMTRQGGKFGVRLKASAPSIHMLSVDVQTEVNPIIGTEKQSEEILQHMLSEFQSDPAAIWSTDIFGKSLQDVVRDSIAGKLGGMPDDARFKLQETLERMVNEGGAGMLCVLL